MSWFVIGRAKSKQAEDAGSDAGMRRFAAGQAHNPLVDAAT